MIDTEGLPEVIALALDRMANVFRKKNADYAGEAPDWAANLVEAGEDAGLSPAQVCEALIGVKQSRLRSLRGRTAVNEAVDDTVLDRAVYAVMALALVQEGRGC